MPGAIATESRWAHPSEIVAAARDQVDHTLHQHILDVKVDPDVPVQLDPRLTATALAHLLENAAQCAPSGSTIRARVFDGRGFGDPGARSWPRHRAGRLAASVRAVLPRRRGEGARVGHRHGPLDRTWTAGGGTGPDLGGELSRRRRAVHHRGPAPRRNAEPMRRQPDDATIPYPARRR